MQKHNQFLFLTLKVFAATGGIEKVCRVAGKALYELEENKLRIFSMHDPSAAIDTKYFPAHIFKGFSGKKIKFTAHALRQGVKTKCVIISHINLLSVGFLIKLFSSKTKLVLYVHGVEVWNPLPKWKVALLKKCDKILAVSSYTKQQLKDLYNIDEKCSVLNNCLDPFLSPADPDIQLSLFKRYNLSKENFILLTVTRIVADEKYKGHEKVIEAMGKIINQFPQLRYLVVGKYDISEKERLAKLIQHHKLETKVIFTGMVPDEELASHYTLADLFVMPSRGEGFGIVFIEAMYYGLPVIAGNKDGSVDALRHGELGLLVDPVNVEELVESIKKVVIKKNDFVPDANVLLQNFSYNTYKKNLRTAIN